RGLSGDQLREQDVRPIRELRQDREDQASFRVAPPRSAERLAGHDPDDARQRLVLLEQEPLRPELAEDLVSRAHGTRSRGPVGRNRPGWPRRPPSAPDPRPPRLPARPRRNGIPRSPTGEAALPTSGVDRRDARRGRRPAARRASPRASPSLLPAGLA